MNKERYLKYLTLVEESLDGVFSGLRDCPAVLKESMRYTVTAGGKRIRPVLLLGAVDAMGGDVSKALPLADAVELIHTYSLIHDDLPCMDNDDIRRGKIANHLKFGEAVALLAGDALLTLAFELAGNAVAGGCDPRVVSVIAEYAGYAGMIGGQADELSGGEMNEERLLAIERNKTGRMLQLPLALAALICAEKRDLFEAFAEQFGILFQTMDDLSDRTEKVSSNAVLFFGCREAKARAESAFAACVECLKELPYDTSFLEYVVRMIAGKDEN